VGRLLLRFLVLLPGLFWLNRCCSFCVVGQRGSSGFLLKLQVRLFVGLGCSLPAHCRGGLCNYIHNQNYNRHSSLGCFLHSPRGWGKTVVHYQNTESRLCNGWWTNCLGFLLFFEFSRRWRYKDRKYIGCCNHKTSSISPIKSSKISSRKMWRRFKA